MYRSKKRPVFKPLIPEVNNPEEIEIPAKRAHRVASASTISNTPEPINSQSSVENSQENVTTNGTRQFLSQRNATQNVSKSNSRIPNNYFETVLLNAKVDLDDYYYVLNTDPYTFRRRLDRIFRLDADYPNNATKFLRGLEPLLNDANGRTKIFGAYVTDKSFGNRFQAMSKESMAMLLMSFDFLQKPLMEMIFMFLEENSKDPVLTTLALTQFVAVDNLDNRMTIEDKLKTILERSSTLIKKEIFKSFEYLIDRRSHNSAVQIIFQHFPRDEDLLTTDILVIIKNLNLDSIIIAQIRHRISRYLPNVKDKTMYPLYVQFLLYFGKDEMQNISNIIEEFRNSMNWDDVLEDLRNNNEDVHRELFSTFFNSFYKCLDLHEAWITYFANLESPEKHFPFDYVFMLIISLIYEEKCLTIESILRTKIMKNCLTIEMYEKTMVMIGKLIGNHSVNLIGFANTCFTDKDVKIAQFGIKLFVSLFKLTHFEKVTLLKFLVRYICIKCELKKGGKRNLKLEFGINAIKIIWEINKQFPDQILMHISHLFTIFDFHENLDFNQYREFMNLMCYIAYTSPLRPRVDHAKNKAVREQLDQLMQKQVISVNLLTKKHGIIGFIRKIHNRFWRPAKEKQSKANEFTEELLKDTRFVLKCCSRSLDSLACFYDELASELSLRDKNKSNRQQFLPEYISKLLEEAQTKLCLEFFKTTFSASTIDGIDFVDKFGIAVNQLQKSNSQIWLDIGPKMLTQQNNRYIGKILCPLFNLVCLLYKYDNITTCLENIQDALVAPIVVPDYFMEEEELNLFDGDGSCDVHNVLNMYHYIANWFRTLISVFSEEVKVRESVMKRVTHLVQIHRHIDLLKAKMCYSYRAPRTNFFKANSLVLPKVFDAEKVSNKDAKVPKVKKMKETFYNFEDKLTFRQIDYSILYLFGESVVVEYPLSQENIGKKFGIAEYDFLIEDLCLKIELLTGQKKLDCEQPFLPDDPERFISELMTYIPNITFYFHEKIVKSLRDLEEDDVSEQSKFLKVILGNYFRLFSALLSWDKFLQDENHDKLVTVFKELCITKDRLRIDEYALTALEKFAGYKDICLNINSAIHLLHFCEVLSKYTAFGEGNEYIIDVCGCFLKKTWMTLEGIYETGAKFNNNLNKILNAYLSRIRLEELDSMVNQIEKDLSKLEKGSDTFKSYPCITKANIPLLFRNMMNSLVNAGKKIDAWEKSPENRFVLWELSQEIAHRFEGMALKIDSIRMYFMCMKWNRLYVKSFIKYAIPFIRSRIGKKNEQVRCFEMFVRTQLMTRFLHRLCCTAKKNGIKSMWRQVPAVRKTQEEYVCEIDNLMVRQGVAEKFSIYSLKNKDVYCNDILTQQTEETVSDNPSSENEEEEREEEQDKEEEDIENEESDYNLTQHLSSRSILV